MSHEFLEFSIVIPCLNEAKTLPIVLDKALLSFKRLGIHGEVVVADNGSTDDSVKIAEHHGGRVIHCPQKGYGNALIAGFKAARGKYMIMGDADDSYNFEEIEGFVARLREGCDLVMGTRLKGHIQRGAMPFLHRYVGTPVLTFLLNLFFGTKISDCNCGMRGISKAAFEILQLEAQGMEFASEMIIKAGILHLKICEIPITLYQDKRGRKPHLNTWRDGWRHLKFMLLYAPNFLFIYPGMAAFVIGSVLTLTQFNGPFAFGPIFWDLHVMILGLTLSLLGIFVLQMGMIIKLFSSLRHYYSQDRLARYLRTMSMEKQLLIGVFFVLVGLVIDGYIFWVWAGHDFKNIFMPQKAIVSLYFLFIGLSMIFFAFFRAILVSPHASDQQDSVL